MWQTEQGYDAPITGVYTPRHQGRWTMMQFMVFEQYNLPKEHNYLWYTKSGGFWQMPMWMENDDGSLNPEAALVRVWSEELYGKTFAQAYTFGPTGNDLNSLYVGDLFTGSTGSVAAFMSCGIPNGHITLQVSGSTIHVISAFGVASDLPVTNGQVILPVPEIPVYVELAAGQTLAVAPMNWGNNLAQQSGVTITASSGSDSRGTGLLNNGVLEDWYLNPNVWCWAGSTSFPSWVEVDLPAKTTVARVVVYAGFPWQTRGTLVDYELDYDNNGQWVTIERITEPTKTWGVFTPTVHCTVDSYFSDRYNFVHEFTPVTTQKIRLLVYQCSYGGGATAIVNQAGGQASGTPTFNLREIEIYGSANLTNVGPVITSAAWATPNPVTLPSTAAMGVAATDTAALTYTWSQVSGPGTTTFSPNGTAASANSTATFSAAGTYVLCVTVADSAASVTSNVTVTVLSATSSAPVISSATTASGTVGQAFSYQITASNSPTSYNAANLPAGLSVNTSSGAITGAPTAAGASSVTISATNAGGTGTATLSITISAPPSGGLPAPWQHQDIGGPGIAGGASYASGVFTVQGGGADI